LTEGRVEHGVLDLSTVSEEWGANLKKKTGGG